MEFEEATTDKAQYRYAIAEFRLAASCPRMDLDPREAHRRTGFSTLQQLLKYVFVIYKGNLATATKNRVEVGMDRGMAFELPSFLRYSEDSVD